VELLLNILSNKFGVKFGSVTDVFNMEELKQQTKLLSQVVVIAKKYKTTTG